MKFPMDPRQMADMQRYLREGREYAGRVPRDVGRLLPLIREAIKNRPSPQQLAAMREQARWASEAATATAFSSRRPTSATSRGSCRPESGRRCRHERGAYPIYADHLPRGSGAARRALVETRNSGNGETFGRGPGGRLGVGCIVRRMGDR